MCDLRETQERDGQVGRISYGELLGSAGLFAVLSFVPASIPYGIVILRVMSGEDSMNTVRGPLQYVGEYVGTPLLVAAIASFVGAIALVSYAVPGFMFLVWLGVGATVSCLIVGLLPGVLALAFVDEIIGSTLLYFGSIGAAVFWWKIREVLRKR